MINHNTHPDSAAADTERGVPRAGKPAELSRWECTEQNPNTSPGSLREDVPTDTDMNARRTQLENPAERPARVSQSVEAPAVAPAPHETNALVSPVIIARAAALLLLFAGGCLASVILGSPALLEPGVIFGGLAVVLLLATISGIQVRFSCKFFSLAVETRSGSESH